MKMPQHGAAIFNLAASQQEIKREDKLHPSMKLPSVQECEALFQQYHVPKNIFGHCRTVSALAVRIAEKLNAKGIPIDIELVRIGALMHDWMKAATLEQLGTNKYFQYTPTKEEIESWKKLRAQFKGKHESEIAYELLKDKYHEFAGLLLHEGALSSDLARHRNWEEKVIHYADWRVRGMEIVTLKKRMDDFFVRYNNQIMKRGKDYWEKLKQTEQKAEQEICTLLNCPPEGL